MTSQINKRLSIDKYGNIKADGNNLLLGGVTTPMVAGDHMDAAKENARRMVACWNACAGFSTESLDDGLMASAESALLDVKRQRDKLLAVLKDVIECDLIPERTEPSLRTKAMVVIADVEAGK